ncbi:MAG TPA: hypothetical protein VN903_39590, partial [Polyangia bacterium]|nr:hypothetical protein [Polyangia bacterium]
MAWRACGATMLLVLIGCGGGGGSPKSDSTIRFQLTAAQEITGLASVRLTAGSAAKTLTLSSLSTTPMVFEMMISSSVTGTIDVGALARPASGCTGYGGTATAYLAGGDVVTVTIVMAPQDICGPTGTGGTGGSTGAAGTGGAAGGGGAGTGGSTTGMGGRGGTTGVGGTGGAGGVAGTGAAGTTGVGATGGRGGTTGVAGTGGGGTGGRGGTTGVAGTSGVAGTGGGGTGGRGGTTG